MEQNHKESKLAQIFYWFCFALLITMLIGEFFVFKPVVVDVYSQCHTCIDHKMNFNNTPYLCDCQENIVTEGGI